MTIALPTPIGVAFSLLRRFWWAIPIAALSALLVITRARRGDARQTLDNELSAMTAEIARADRRLAETEKRYVDRQAAAALTFADRLAEREPIILRSTNTLRALQRPAGGVPVGVAAVLPSLGDQRIQFPHLGRLAAAARDAHLRLDLVEVRQDLGSATIRLAC